MILYLHGFLSTGQSAKGQWFKRAFAQQGIEVFTPTYPIKTPDESIAVLEQAIGRLLTAKKPWLVMGSSMGGFYGQYLAQKYQKPLIMINPALDAVGVLAAYSGEQVHPITQEHLNINEDYLAALKSLSCLPSRQIPSLLLLDEGDEVIPYLPSAKAYEGIADILCFPNGSHGFDHLEEAWPKVSAFALSHLR